MLERFPVVLLVEDDDVLRDALTRQLRSRRYSVVPLATSRDANAVLAFMSPAALVCDFMLADGDAVGVVATFAGTGRPVVLISGLNEAESFARTRGIVFLRKPVDIEDLCAALEAQLAPPSDP